MNRKLFAISLLAAFVCFGCSDENSKDDPIVKGCNLNNIVEGTEICDGSAFAPGAKVCPQGMVLKAGKTVEDIKCSMTCTVDASDACEVPATCGNNVLDAGEICDGAQFAAGKRDCADGQRLVEGKTVNDITCSSSCVLVTDGVCEAVPADLCGNSVLDAGEVCDGDKFADGKRVCPEGTKLADGKTVNDITCNACALVTDGICEAAPAELCGNSTLDAGEVCDGDKFADGKRVCPEGQRLVEGKTVNDITCNACALVTDGICEAVPAELCGNSTLDTGEVCDGDKFAEGKRACPEGTKLADGKTVNDITCNACALVTDGICEKESEKPVASCGNGALDAGEVCDGDKFADGKRVCPEGTKLADGKTVNDITCNACALVTDGICVQKDAPAESTFKCKSETVLELCDDSGCITEDCSEKGQICKEVNGVASCVAKPGGCINDESRCVDGVLSVCENNQWVEIQDCNAEGMTCTEASGKEGKCTYRPCEKKDENKSQCTTDGKYVLTCMKDKGDTYSWLSLACDPGQSCEGSMPNAACVQLPACGDGIIKKADNETCDFDADGNPFFESWMNVTCNYYDDSKIFVSGAPSCTDKCKISVQNCVEAQDSDYTQIKSWKFTSSQQIKDMTKSGGSVKMNGVFGAGNSDYDSKDKGWRLGNWGSNAYSKSVIFTVGKVETKGVMVVFDVRRTNNTNSPKKLAVRFLDGTKKIHEFAVIDLNGETKTTQKFGFVLPTVPVNDFKFEISAFQAKTEAQLVISNIIVQTVDAM